MIIDWKLERLDEGEREPRPQQCLLEMTGEVREGGDVGGRVAGFYLSAPDLDSDAAFWELWDLDVRSCSIVEEIVDEKWRRFREPLPRLLRESSGMICLEQLTLAPAFRGRGLGLEVMREVIRTCAGEWVGAILLRSDPRQYGEDLSKADKRALQGLPRDDCERDRTRLQSHFRSWGMQRLPRTRYMVCAPDTLCAERADRWPPVLIEDGSNICVLCSGRIDFEREEWEEGPEGPAHKGCLDGS